MEMEIRLLGGFSARRNGDDCGCEIEVDDGHHVVGELISYCAEHDLHGVGVYTCGECGFASWAFDRLERHVYGVHPGA